MSKVERMYLRWHLGSPALPALLPIEKIDCNLKKRKKVPGLGRDHMFRILLAYLVQSALW